MKRFSLLLGAAAIMAFGASTMTANAGGCDRMNVAMSQPSVELTVTSSATIVDENGLTIASVMSDETGPADVLVAFEKADRPPTREAAASWSKVEKHPSLYAGFLLEDVVDENGLTGAVSADNPIDYGPAMKLAAFELDHAQSPDKLMTDRRREHGGPSTLDDASSL